MPTYWVRCPNDACCREMRVDAEALDLWGGVPMPEHELPVEIDGARWVCAHTGRVGRVMGVLGSKETRG